MNKKRKKMGKNERKKTKMKKEAAREMPKLHWATADIK